MKHRIEIRPYEYECGDGCCHESGSIVKVDGGLVADVAHCNELDALESILAALGIDAEIVEYDLEGDER